jgi:hypothetical protein
MNALELLQFSLGNALGIFGQVTADLTQEQTDWEPPGTANTIGSLYWHVMAYVDHAVHDWGLGRLPLSQENGWREKVLAGKMPGVEPGQVPAMQKVQVDLSALHDYASIVQDTAQKWLASITLADLETKIETPAGELTLAQMLEIYVIWHINAHCGEISALKGCQGAQGYTF